MDILRLEDNSDRVTGEDWGVVKVVGGLARNPEFEIGRSARRRCGPIQPTNAVGGNLIYKAAVLFLIAGAALDKHLRTDQAKGTEPGCQSIVGIGENIVLSL